MTLLRRNWSMARRLAVCISQAPGFCGMPLWGHCCRATTNASLASSSARPTSRVILVRPAINLAASMRQTASTARCVANSGLCWSMGGGVDQIHAAPATPCGLLLLLHLLIDHPGVALALFRREAEIVGGHARPDLALHVAVPIARRPLLDHLDHLGERARLEDREPRDELLGLGERAICAGGSAVRERDA